MRLPCTPGALLLQRGDGRWKEELCPQSGGRRRSRMDAARARPLFGRSTSPGGCAATCFVRPAAPPSPRRGRAGLQTCRPTASRTGRYALGAQMMPALPSPLPGRPERNPPGPAGLARPTSSLGGTRCFRLPACPPRSCGRVPVCSVWIGCCRRPYTASGLVAPGSGERRRSK